MRSMNKTTSPFYPNRNGLQEAHMRKILAPTLAAVTAVGAVLATAAPAQAQHYRYYHHHHDNGDEVAAAIAGGVVGLALGSALSNHSSGRYYNDGYYRSYPYRSGYYDRGYYARPYAYSSYGYDDDYYRPRVCISRDRVWDPYIGRRVTIERRYAC
jgi:hypothetical protein